MEVYLKRIDDLESNIRELLEQLSWRDTIGNGDRVMIKPNFCTHRLRNGVTTNMELLGHIIAILKERTQDVFIGETHSFGKDFKQLEANFDLDCDLVNLSDEETHAIDSPWGTLNLPKIALDSKIINAPVLKTHSLTGVTFGIKNLFGLLQDKDKSKYHSVIDDLLVYLLGFLKPCINILDASYVMDGYGPISGRVRKTDFLLASKDVVSLDRAVCKIIGMEPSRIKHIHLASEKYGATDELVSNFELNLDLEVPVRGNIEKLGTLLLEHGPTRKLLMHPLVYPYANKIKNLLKKFHTSELKH
ncbi:MAG: DUF362 domain-containing protein [Candidatus Hydrothermarchaeales archaeon]